MYCHFVSKFLLKKSVLCISVLEVDFKYRLILYRSRWYGCQSELSASQACTETCYQPYGPLGLVGTVCTDHTLWAGET